MKVKIDSIQFTCYLQPLLRTRISFFTGLHLFFLLCKDATIETMLAVMRGTRVAWMYEMILIMVHSAIFLAAIAAGDALNPSSIRGVISIIIGKTMCVRTVLM
jgi:hypothetical protein